MTQRQADLFDESWTPLKVGFWCQPHHWAALASGLGANEAEALRYEYQLVRIGQRDVLGRPCLCSAIDRFPEAVRGGAGGIHDSMSTFVGLISDLKRAADGLPISWRETHRIFIVQERETEWWRLAGLLRRGVQYRPEDRMPDLGRQHAWAWMAWVLGWQGRCRYPRREQLATAA